MKTRLILAFTLLLIVAGCTAQNAPEPVTLQETRTSSIIELSGDTYFPDGIAAHNDGTLFVGSMWSGEINKVPSGELQPVSFAPPEADGRTVLGLHVDEDANRLWAVFWDFQGFMSIPAQLKAFDLESGDVVAVFDYPAGVIGNDLTMDGDGHLYTTCSFTHQIYRLPAGGDALEVWSDAPELAAGHQEGWTLNGIEWNKEDALYLSRTDNDAFYRIPINDDGSAGAVQPITIDDAQSNMGYDGIALVDTDTILLTEYATNRVTLIDIEGNEGTKRVVGTELDFPTSAAIVGDGVWVVESQIDHLLYPDAAGAPQAPFQLQYLPLPSQ